MALEAKNLFGGAITALAGGATAQKVFINPDNTRTVITVCSAPNIDTVVRWINISLVPNASGSVGVEADANSMSGKLEILATRSIRFIDNAKVVLENKNDSIQVYAEAANIFNLHMMGTQETYV